MVVSWTGRRRCKTQLPGALTLVGEAVVRGVDVVVAEFRRGTDSHGKGGNKHRQNVIAQTGIWPRSPLDLNLVAPTTSAQ
jgi:hypothetical protein